MSLVVGNGLIVGVVGADSAACYARKTLADLGSTYLATNHTGQVVEVTDGGEQPRTWAYSRGPDWISVYTQAVLATDPNYRTDVLRFSSPMNRMPNFPLAPNLSYAMYNCCRAEHEIGSDQQDELRMLALNCYLWTGSVEKPGNALTILRTFIEIPGVATLQVLWNGVSGRALTNGEFGAVSDALRPAAFGLKQFVRGTKYFTRTEVMIPANGKLCTVDTWDTANFSGHRFDGSAVQCTNLAGSGPLFYSGAVTYAAQSWTPIMLGKFVSGDPVSVLGVGDSILNGAGDTNATRGRGFYGRSVLGPTPADGIASCNASRPAGNSEAWMNAPALADLVKYANTGLNEYGTNFFGSGANLADSALNYWVDREKNIHAVMKANASKAPGVRQFRVLRTELIPRINPPTDNTVANQTVLGEQYGVGGSVDAFNAKVTADPNVDVVVSFTSVMRASPDIATREFHLVPNGVDDTVDGTHPTTKAHIRMDGVLYPILRAA